MPVSSSAWYRVPPDGCPIGQCRRGPNVHPSGGTQHVRENGVGPRVGRVTEPIAAVTATAMSHRIPDQASVTTDTTTILAGRPACGALHLATGSSTAAGQSPAGTHPPAAPPPSPDVRTRAPGCLRAQE